MNEHGGVLGYKGTGKIVGAIADLRMVASVSGVVVSAITIDRESAGRLAFEMMGHLHTLGPRILPKTPSDALQWFEQNALGSSAGCYVLGIAVS